MIKNPPKETYTKEEVEALLAKRKRRGRPRGTLIATKKGVEDHAKRQARNQQRSRTSFKNSLVTVTLKMSHNVNGDVYGPGEVTVSTILANSLLHQEHYSNQIEEQFQGEKAAIIGGRTAQGVHRVIEVAPATFDSDLMNENAPVGVVIRSK